MKGNTMPNGDRPPLGNLDDDYGGHWRISEKELEEGRRQAEKRPLLPRQMRESDTPEKSKEWKGNTMLLVIRWYSDDIGEPCVRFFKDNDIKAIFDELAGSGVGPDKIKAYRISDLDKAPEEFFNG